MARLSAYKAKRDFSSTPEPPGGEEADAAGRGRPGRRPRFVVHEHHARSLHWDLRLEREGVLVSWAVPKGIPRDPATNHLAVPTEDHPLGYLEFSGEIPAGSYGAGRMSIWDSGTYDCEKWEDREISLTFHGVRLRGRHVLFATGERSWMLHRVDPPEDPAYEEMPERVEPMLATLADEVPSGDWAFEVKWDGVRAVAFVSEGRLRLQGRSGSDFTARYPEIRPLAEELADHRLVLDGEVVALDEKGRPDFERLQKRMHRAAGRGRRAGDPAVTYMIFDLLYLDGHSTMGLPYSERRRLLEGLGLSGPAWRTPASHVGDGPALLAASLERGLEGLVAKRADSRYEPGRRTRSWLKVKNRLTQDVVLGGWLPGEGRRTPTLGSFLAGVHEGGSLRYAGRVGSGLKESDLAELSRTVEGLARKESPFVPPPELPAALRRAARFLEPVLVARVELAEWTDAGTMRAPVFKQLREGADPASAAREPGWRREIGARGDA
jgi:bifunctional non-homologous end joining protein LigD